MDPKIPQTLPKDGGTVLSVSMVLLIFCVLSQQTEKKQKNSLDGIHPNKQENYTNTKDKETK